MDNVRRRFYYRVKRIGDHLIWTGTLSNNGYGITTVNGRRTRATHAAWFLKTGKWPQCNKWPKDYVLHKNSCHVRMCVNADHLYIGDNHDNQWDRWAKYRELKGK